MTAREIPSARILLVEDDFLVALDLEHRLADAGFDVVGIAASAEEAVRLASTERPALAIMDIRLSGSRDGVDAAIELYQTLQIPSIFATAHADDSTKRRAEPAHPRGWVQKPYAAGPLIELIRSALDQA